MCISYHRCHTWSYFHFLNHLTLNFSSIQFLVDGWSLPYISPTELIHPQSNIHEYQANMDINHKLVSHAVWRWLECVQKCQSGLWSCFVVLGAHVGVLAPINVAHFSTNFAWTLKMLILVEVVFLYAHVKMAFVLTWTIHFNIWIFSYP